MAHNYYMRLEEGEVYGLTADDLAVHLKLDLVGDDGDADYLLRHVVPAAYMTAERFLNRTVYPDENSRVAVDERIANPEDYPEGDRVDFVPKSPMVANAPFVAAVKLIVGHLYRNREDTTAENLKALPMGAQALLFPWRTNMGI